jgi:hypothetical protein
MAVVVEQVNPFSAETLQFDHANRWISLFPLIRPSIKAVQTTQGQNILVDTNKSSGDHVHIVAVESPGHFSSKLLENKRVTAIVTSKPGLGLLHPTHLPHALRSAGIEVSQGIVVVRAGETLQIHVHQPDVMEIETGNELEQDHVLQLLTTATGATRGNPHHVSELLRTFVKNVRATHSKLYPEKVDGKPAVLHADGPQAYDQVKEAVERDLKRILDSHHVEGDLVHAVHFSDVNGLSRLEIYIILGDMAHFLGRYM